MKEIYKEIFKLTQDTGLSRACLAMAAVESSWWEDVPMKRANNPHGIKAVGKQPVLDGHEHLRKFDTLHLACASWLYLVKESKNHTESRMYLPPRGEIGAGAWMVWANSFLKTYCPRDPDYPAKFGGCFVSPRLDKIIAEAEAE